MYFPEEIKKKIDSLKKSWKYQQALELVNEYLKKDPTNEDLLLEVTEIQYAMGELDKAEKPINFLIKYKSSKDPLLWYTKWVLEMDKTNWNSARKYLQKALELLDNDNPEVIRCYWLSEYWHWNKQRWIKYLEKAYNITNGRDVEILLNLLEIYLLEKEYNKARKLINTFRNYYKSWALEFFNKSEKFYLEKIELYSRFLDIQTNK